jgi:iron complex transport system substrate-binding protein
MTKCKAQFRHWSLVIGHSLVILVWSLVIDGCSPPATPIAAKSPRVASLVPGATDLIVGMGAADHLVAVSNWDTDRPEIAQLPRVGDYQTTDWEKLAGAKPQIMVVFFAPDRVLPGFRERADALGARLINVGVERLDDIFKTIDNLGQALNESDKASQLKQRIRDQLDGVTKRVDGKPKIRALLARDEEGYALIAGDTFADDLLTIAGGRNVAAGIGVRYPSVDRERVLELAPEVIIQLMPDASPQVIERARQSWAKLDVPAVRNGRVYILTDWYVLQPGSHVGELAMKLSETLHP